MKQTARAVVRQTDRAAVVAWLAFVLAPSGTLLFASLSGASFWPTVVATTLATLSFPAVAGRRRIVSPSLAARWTVAAATVLSFSVLVAHGLPAPVALAAAGVLAVALVDSDDYTRAVRGDRRTPY